jgi:diguanylate cyclase (GGDEF)-like protein
LVNTGTNLVLRDVGSTNGTYVNDELVDEYVLDEGDYIKVGRCILKFLTGGNIEHAYHEEIYRLTTIDGLTQVFNKRYFLETLDREVGRAQRYRRQLSLMIFDIDKFKDINDSMGHLAGDSVLKQLASVVKKSIRRDDVLARYGGEEFAIILPEMGLSNALVVAEKIRSLVEKTVFRFEDERIPVTVSVGVATLEMDWTAEVFIKEADTNLYKAKRAGRNRVVG